MLYVSLGSPLSLLGFRGLVVAGSAVDATSTSAAKPRRVTPTMTLGSRALVILEDWDKEEKRLQAMREQVRDHQTSLVKSLDAYATAAELTFARERQHTRLAFQKAMNDFDMLVNSLDLHDLRAMEDTASNTPKTHPKSTPPPLAQHVQVPTPGSQAKTPQKHPNSLRSTFANTQSDQAEQQALALVKAPTSTSPHSFLDNPELEACLGELQQLAFHSAVQKALHDFASYVNHMDVPVQLQRQPQPVAYREALQHAATQPPLQVAIHSTGMPDIDDIDLSVVSGNELPDLVDELLPRLPRPTTVLFPHNNHTHTARQDETPNLITPSNALDQDQELAELYQSPHSQPSQADASMSVHDYADHEDMPYDDDHLHDRDHASHRYNSQHDHDGTAHYPSFHTFANHHMPTTSTSHFHAPSSQQQTKLDLSHYID